MKAATLGVRVANLDRYRVLPAPDEPGLVLVDGNLADHIVSEAARALAKGIQHVRTGTAPY